MHIEHLPLSRAIKELEEELGVVLFARTTRSTRLTRAGKLFFEHVPRVFSALQQTRDSVKAAANGFHSQLRIAISDGITPSRLPTLLALCRQEEPEVKIRFFEVPLSQQIKGLHGDLYDAGFAGADEVGEPDHPARHVFAHARQPGRSRPGRLCRPGRRRGLPLGPHFRRRSADDAAGRRRRAGGARVIAGRDSAQDSINQVGQEMTRSNMNIQPTLTERPGLLVRIIANRDLVLRPHQPLFFNKGTSR